MNFLHIESFHFHWFRTLWYTLLPANVVGRRCSFVTSCGLNVRNRKPSKTPGFGEEKEHISGLFVPGVDTSTFDSRWLKCNREPLVWGRVPGWWTCQGELTWSRKDTRQVTWMNWQLGGNGVEVINKKHNIKIREVIYEKTLRGVPMFTFITDRGFQHGTEGTESLHSHGWVQLRPPRSPRLIQVEASNLAWFTWWIHLEGLRPIQQKAQTFDIFGLTFQMSVK